jgi:hypothetical protein
MPSNLFYGQWARPDAENPRLASPISAADTTIVATNALLDEDGNAVTGNVMIGCKDGNGYTESIWAGAATSADGITFTGVVRGIDLSGLDNTTQNTATLAVDHEAGDPLFVQISGVNFQLMLSALQGDIGSGGENWQIGANADNDITVYAFNGDANLPFWRYDSATNQWVFSNDGVASTPFGTGAGVTGGDGITVVAGVIAVDLTDTIIFKSTSAGAGDSGKVPRLDGAGILGDDFLDRTTTPTADMTPKADADGIISRDWTTPLVFGNGSTGDLTTSGNVSLTADVFYGDLTVSAGDTITTNGYRIFVKGTCTIQATGVIENNGNNGTAGSPNAGDNGGAGGNGGTATVGSLPINAAGEDGGAGGNVGANPGTVGDPGTAAVKCFHTTNSVAGGNGGAANDTTAGGLGGALAASTDTRFNTFGAGICEYTMAENDGTLFTTTASGGAGGGGGGNSNVGANDGGAGGGGSAASGGFVVLYARTLVNSGDIQATGGAGGGGGNADGTGGGGGGGAGGNGGTIITVTMNKSGAGTETVTGGGAGGAGTSGTGSAGSAGSAGGAGTTVAVDLT